MILHRRRAAPLLLTCVAAALPALASPPPQHPFETILPWSIGRGSIEAGSGLTRRAGAHPPFFTGDRTSIKGIWLSSSRYVAIEIRSTIIYYLSAIIQL